MKIITPLCQHMLDGWYDSALRDPEVSRFLSMTPYWEIPKVKESNWATTHFIQDGTYLCISFSRAESSASICLWTLNAHEQLYSSGKAIKFAMEEIKRSNTRFVETIVHANNQVSIRLNEKLFGKPWGIEPEGAWDGKLSKWVGAAYFKHKL